MKVVVFLGPTLSLEEAHGILPDAIYLPPARQADLLTVAVNEEPRVVGLIDGVFMQTPSVWHKEILFALERGIEIFGASSMGALRAAEVDSFGMVGIGEIYRQYSSGELMDDDEVALAHASAEFGYQKLSEPMVNVRATLLAACEAGVIDRSSFERLVGAAKKLHFLERRFPAIFALAAEDGTPEADLEAVAAFVETRYVDLKAADARLLLETIRDLPEDRPRPRVLHTTGINAGLETMYNRERQVKVGEELVPLADIAEYVCLHDPGFHDLNFNALNRILAVALACLLHIDVTEEEIDEETDRFRKRLDLEGEQAWSDWLDRNNLPREDVVKLMKEAAMCRALHRWLIYARFTERTTRLVLDQLRWENRYEVWAERAAGQQRLLEGRDSVNVLDTNAGETSTLFEEHQRWAAVRFDLDPARWAEESGFNSKADLKLALTRAWMARRAILELLDSALTEVESHTPADQRT